jgi:glutamate formiminotransferase / 5-formyltetrahydrofolate cyclo-ligase
MPYPPPLLAVPNISEGRDATALDAITKAFTAGGETTLLDRHSDPDHHRAVLTRAGRPGALAAALVRGIAAAIPRIDVMAGPHPRGEHPHVGAVDVAPVVYLTPQARGAACAEALVLADRIAQQLEVPVFLYGALAGGRARAQLRRGGVAGLAQRMCSGEQRPDFGPSELHPTAGATLVAAREPLVAFNLELAAPAGVEDARRIAASIREGGAAGLPGLRAIGVALHSRGPASDRSDDDARSRGAYGRARPLAQVSMNVERPLELPLLAVVEAVRRYADVRAAELVGLAPSAAFDGFPKDLPMPGFDPAHQVIEKALGL